MSEYYPRGSGHVNITERYDLDRLPEVVIRPTKPKKLESPLPNTPLRSLDSEPKLSGAEPEPNV
jgi:hypothetical protein